jgi:hypothetical protein
LTTDGPLQKSELPSWKYVNALDLRALWGFFL